MKKKVFRKPLALIVVLTMIVTMLGGFATTAFAEENNVKFSIEISSKAGDEVGTVKAEVYSDFSAKLAVSGSKVNSSNATVTVKMTDVASLGVEGTRTYTREMNFDSNTDVPLSHVTELFDKLVDTSVAFSYGDASVVYEVAKENGEYTLTPSSPEDASYVWHTIVNEDNFTYGTKDEEDSYIVIRQGSWLQIGNSILEFEEDCDEDLTLDDFGNLSNLNKTIRDAVALNQTEDTMEGVSFFLAAGTEIALGSSYACLTTPFVFETELENYAALEECLVNLRDLSGDTTDIMIGLFNALDTVFTVIQEEGAINAQGGPAEEEPSGDDEYLIDYRDEIYVDLALLYHAVDSELYVKETYDAYQDAYYAFKEIAFADDLDYDQLRKARTDVVAAYHKLVLRESIADAVITGLEAVTYTGKAFEPKPVVTLGNKTLEEGQDYEVSYKNNKNAGKATVTVTGCNNYVDTAQGTFTINKAAQKMTVTVKKQTVKLAKVKTKAQIASAKAITVKNAKGTKTFKKVSGSKNLTINKKTGRITVKKGTKKGTYTIKFKVTAKGTANFKAATKTKSVKIVVK